MIVLHCHICIYSMSEQIHLYSIRQMQAIMESVWSKYKTHLLQVHLHLMDSSLSLFSPNFHQGLWLQASHVVIWRKHVSAAVSELRESNQNKEKNSEIGCLQFNTFPEYIIHPFFNRRYL